MKGIIDADRLMGSIEPKYANIFVISSLLKKLQKKSNICNNICDIKYSSVKFDI